MTRSGVFYKELVRGISNDGDIIDSITSKVSNLPIQPSWALLVTWDKMYFPGSKDKVLHLQQRQGKMITNKITAFHFFKRINLRVRLHLADMIKKIATNKDITRLSVLLGAHDVAQEKMVVI